MAMIIGSVKVVDLLFTSLVSILHKIIIIPLFAYVILSLLKMPEQSYLDLLVILFLSAATTTVGANKGTSALTTEVGVGPDTLTPSSWLSWDGLRLS